MANFASVFFCTENFNYFPFARAIVARICKLQMGFGKNIFFRVAKMGCFTTN